MAALSRDRFDDAEWRKTGLLDEDGETWSDQAVGYVHTLDRTHRRGASDRSGGVSGAGDALGFKVKGERLEPIPVDYGLCSVVTLSDGFYC